MTAASDLHAARSGHIGVGVVDLLQGAIDNTANIKGTTHDFYHYPARFSPGVARAAIEQFTRRGDWVLDPFMGGGTTAIEGILLGRRVLGADLNSLAHFVSTVRTRPLSTWDEDVLTEWANRAAYLLGDMNPWWVDRPHLKNLPGALDTFVAGALGCAEQLLPRQQMFARAALLRLGQWSLESRDVQPRRKRLAQQLPVLVDQMLSGLREFTEGCVENGVPKHTIQRRRVLLHRSAVGLETDERVKRLRGRPTLVLTSPPYAGVNVLYHRWQHRGRKETPAPYWIADVKDGCGSSFYTGGSRTPSGLRNYFGMILGAFRSVANMLDDRGVVVQLVGFSDVETQLPMYLEVMRAAGFDECRIPGGRMARKVPNRRWYAKYLKRDADASKEFMLIHRLAR